MERFLCWMAVFVCACGGEPFSLQTDTPVSDPSSVSASAATATASAPQAPPSATGAPTVAGPVGVMGPTGGLPTSDAAPPDVNRFGAVPDAGRPDSMPADPDTGSAAEAEAPDAAADVAPFACGLTGLPCCPSKMFEVVQACEAGLACYSNGVCL